jgi:hypothetical protein
MKPGSKNSSSKNSSSLVLATALLFAFWLLLAWPWLSSAVRIPWDAPAHFQPQFSFLAHSLRSGQSPAWAPYVFGGHVQIADPQSLIFSLPFLLIALFDGEPKLWVMDAVCLGFLLVGGVFVLLYFRDRSWHAAAGLCAALSFIFGGSAAWRLQHVGQVMSIAWLPIALFLLDRSLRRGSILTAVMTGMTAGLMLIGRDQVAFLAVILLAGYAFMFLASSFFKPRAASLSRWLNLRQLLLIGTAGLLTIAVPMVLTLLVAEDSNRPTITLVEAGKGSLHPWSLLTAFFPHLFGIARPLSEYWGPPSPDWGSVDLFLARNMATFYFGMLPAIGLFLFPFVVRWSPRLAVQPSDLDSLRREGRREAWFFFLGCLVFFFYAIGRYAPVFSIFFSIIPGVDKFRRPADALFVASALGSYAGGYALHRWLIAPRMHLPKWAMVLGLICFLAMAASGLLLAKSVGRLEQTWTPVLAAGCFFAASLLMLALVRRVPQGSMVTVALLGGFMAADLGWNNAPNESTGLDPAIYEVLQPGSTNETLAILKQKVAETSAPDRIDRVEMVGIDFHWPNASLTHRLHHTLGYNPVRSGIYSASVGARDHIAGPDQRLFTPLLPGYKSPMADLVGLRFVATSIPLEDLYRVAPRKHLPEPLQGAPLLMPGDLPLIARTSQAFIYENPRALPRVMMVTSAQSVDFDALIRTGNWPEFDPRETVLLGRPLTSAEAALKPGRGDARILSYRNTEVVVETSADTAGFLVLNDTWQEWWQVEVDGRPAVLDRANVTFRAVAVPAGVHKVRFVFRPFRGAWAEVLERLQRK